jgi:hypothetical protein
MLAGLFGVEGGEAVEDQFGDDDDQGENGYRWAEDGQADLEARVDGHAVPSIPSGSPRMTKLPRLSTSELRLARAGRRCSPIGPCICHRR